VRDWNTTLDASLHFEQLEMHVHGIRQIWLSFLQRAKFHRFA
jgi:hypothetical protein